MIAGGYIALRKMKNNHTMVVSAYTNLALMLVSFIVILITGIGFGFISHLSLFSWLLLTLSGVLSIGD
jgi:drug/metabolite transporter superfamily protein YnfA